jgi:hypothetical protein
MNEKGRVIVFTTNWMDFSETAGKTVEKRRKCEGIVYLSSS